MVVSAVSAVRFTGQDMLSRPGAFAKDPEEVVQRNPKAKKSSSKTAKIVAGTVIGAAAILGGAAALKHFKPETFKIIDAEKFADAKKLEKVCHYVAKLGNFVIEQGNNFKNMVTGWFTRKK